MTTTTRSGIIPRGSAARLALVLLAGAVGVVIAASGLLEPAAGRFVPKCPTNYWFHLYCPACGGTRAIMRLVHGDFSSALRHNPMVVLGLPVAVYCFVVGVNPFARDWRRWEVVVLLTCLIAFTVLRNITAWPWELLAPPR